MSYLCNLPFLPVVLRVRLHDRSGLREEDTEDYGLDRSRSLKVPCACFGVLALPRVSTPSALHLPVLV